MSDANQYINTYLDTAMTMLHDYINNDIRSKTELKMANDMLAVKDKMIQDLTDQVERIKNEKESFQNSVSSNNEEINKARQHAHSEIWQFHRELHMNGVRHLFFNGNSDFSGVANHHDWGINYMAPYDPENTYNKVLRNNGFATVRPDSWHFGEAAHCFWAEHVLNYCKLNNLV